MPDPKYENENRTKILEDYQALGSETSRSLVRLMTAYDRYTECLCLINTLGNVCGMKILDFGCGVSDYGLFFARRNARMAFYDHPVMIDLVKYRMDLEKLPGEYHKVYQSKPDFRDFEFIIFSEVLEHLQSPLEILKECYEANVTYLFTTAYPFVTDMNYFLHKGHSKLAGEEQDEVRKFLEEKYDKLDHYTGGQYLWKRK